MIDPIPRPPTFLSRAVTPFATSLSLHTLPLHIHEVLFAIILYTTVQNLSPFLSARVFPNHYPKLAPRTRLNWDVHVVSLVQSCLVNTLALWVMFTDTERAGMSRWERIYGYTGGCGIVQGMAAGYFAWDLMICTRYIGIFGASLWAHAVCALGVFMLGFRPFCNFYGPTFILYELSSPFLNIHWFCDKLNLTGSPLQWYNGMVLLGTFFGCRLVWGTYQSVQVFQDLWEAINLDSTMTNGMVGSVSASTPHPLFIPRDGELCLGDMNCVAAQVEVMKFAANGVEAVPLWLAGTYLGANLVLNSLNWVWFGRMIETVMKRFREKPEKAVKAKHTRKESVVIEVADGLEQDDMMHGSMVLEKDEGESTAVDGEADVKKR